MPDSEHRALRNALGAFATGITIVTAAGTSGKPVGLTVNSFSSVSLAPPLVAWSLRQASPLLNAFATGKRCAIHVLRADQELLARRFASPDVDRFVSAAWHADAEGVPILDGVLARFDCRTEAAHDAGDHKLLLARIERYVSQPGTPLLFAGGCFRAL
jgi:flavin reductase (DIM6/NTAB) family NADH-FMN oxidoreductase RutF